MIVRYLLVAVALLGCLSASPLLAEGPIKFKDVSDEVGIAEPLAGMMGHGGAWGDYDGDGWLDIFVGGFCDRPNEEYKPAAGPVPTRLLRNIEGKRFESAGQSDAEFYGRASGAVFADLDNNGTVELYVANNARPSSKNPLDIQRNAQTRMSQLFKNDNGRLVDISKSSGAVLDDLLSARNIGPCDYNGDGLLDLFIIEDIFVGRMATPRCVLLKNLGNLKFEDVTSEVGLPEKMHGLGLAIADLNGDHRPDFFIPHSNRLFYSKPDGKYAESEKLTELFSFETIDKHEEWPCGAAFSDLNRDGLLDLVLSLHCKPARNRLFLNTGAKKGVPTFREITAEAGLGEQIPEKCPHVELQDFDNDGWPDIYMSAGWLDGDKFEPLIYRHQGLKNGIPTFAPSRKIDGEMVYYPAGPTADYDKDGRLDIFLINWFQGNRSRLLKNDSPERNWLQVNVLGKSINRQGIGSQVKVYKAGKLGDAKSLLGFQELTTGYGYASGQDAMCHFGLGDETTVDLEVTLPNGQVVKQPGVKSNARVTIEEPATK